MTQSRNSSRGFTAVELVLVIVVIAIVMSVTLVQVDKKRQARLRVESAQNLILLHLLLRGLTDINVSSPPNWLKMDTWVIPAWPSLSTSPGQLVPEITDARTQYLVKSINQNVLISPAHPEAERLRIEAVSNPASAFTDDSYWYLGFALPTEEAGLTFVGVYRKAFEETGRPPTSDVLNVKFPDPRIDAEPGGIFPLGNYEYFLKEGQEPQESSLNIPYSRIPVFIERPGLQKGGSSVLFLDRHVEFIPYPGPWPMTENFIKALESLDELKVKE